MRQPRHPKRNFGTSLTSSANLLAASALLSASPMLADELSVLVFSRTEGFRHDSIASGLALVQALGTEQGFAVDSSEATTLFTDAGLADYDVVVFLNTTGDVLDVPEQEALERFVQAGGGWVGVHSAADTEYDWPWYGQLLGGAAWFLSHPAIQTATLVVEDAEHPSSAHLAPSFSFQDEWYNFLNNPRTAVEVLLHIDETSYEPGSGAMGDHPIAWYHRFDGGRAWYTVLGHRSETYADADFRAHLLGGILWSAGLVLADGFETGDTGAWSEIAP